MTNILDLVAYKNGEYKPLGEIGPSVLDFGFIHCDATYDVMPVYNGKAFCYERHLQRFKTSARRYGLKLPDLDPLDIIKELAKRNPIENAFVWFSAWRGYPPSGNPRDLENCPVNFAMYIKPSYPIASTPLVKLYLDKDNKRVNDDYYGQQFKNMAWLELTMSQLNCPAGFDTTVLIDTEGAYYLLTTGSVAHKLFHTWVAATIIAVLCATFGKYLCEFGLRIWNNFILNEKYVPSLKWMRSSSKISKSEGVIKPFKTLIICRCPPDKLFPDDPVL